MNELTWKEFKEEVDKELKRKGISEDTAVWYIDISFPQKDGVCLSINEDKMISIYE